MKRTIIMALTAFIVFGMTTVNTFAQDAKGKQFMDKLREGIDPAAIAGIYNYDTEAVLKAIKVKRAAKQNEVASIFEAYNADLGSLKHDNIGLLVNLGTSVRDIVREKEYGRLLGARSDYKDSVGKIRVKQLAMHGEMEEELFELLTRRQQRKWHKYQEKRSQEAASTFDIGDLSLLLGL